MRKSLIGLALVVVLCGCATEADVQEWEGEMHRIDTPNAAAVPKVAGPAGTPGHFDDSTPGAITTLDADWCEAVQEEIANVITGLGGSLSKSSVNQMATLIVNYLRYAGRFDLSLFAIKDTDPSVPDGYRFRVWDGGGGGSLSAIARTDSLRTSAIKLGNDGSEITAIDLNRDAYLRDIETTGDIDVNSKASITGATGDIATDGNVQATGNIEVHGKIKNAASADVVFDDGIEVEGLITADSGIATVAPSTVAATWNADHWEATINQVGGRISVDFSAHSLSAGSGVLLVVTNNKMDATDSRIYWSAEHQGATAGGGQGLPIVIAQPNTGGAQSIVIHNVGSGSLNGGNAWFAFDIINPA